MPVDGRGYKDGFHILIPEIQCIKGLKQWIVGQLRNEELLARIFRGAESINQYVEAVDMGSVRNPVYFWVGLFADQGACMASSASET